MQHPFTTFRERGRQDRIDEKHRYHYQHHHNYLPPPLPPTLTEQEIGGGKKRKNLRNSVTLSFILIQFSTRNLERHYQPHAGP